MAEDKAKLLRSLAIDRGRDAAPPPARRRWPVLVASAGIVVVALLLAALLVPELRVAGKNEPTVRQPQPAPAAPLPTIAEARRPGSLVASGYVVARRKATVAAEITGKV